MTNELRAIVRCPKCERDSQVIGSADYPSGRGSEVTSPFRYQFRCNNGHTFWAIPYNQKSYYILDSVAR